GPPPFSSMNSTPADSKAWRSAASLACVTGISPSTTSTRRIVATPTFDAFARSSALQRTKARAARIWALEIFFGISCLFIQYDVIYITNDQEVHVRTLSDSTNRRSFIGGSDARIIMGDDEGALLRLW